MDYREKKLKFMSHYFLCTYCNCSFYALLMEGMEMRLGLHYSLLSRVSELLLCALQLNIVTKPIHWRRFILYLHFSFKHMSTTPYWLHN